MTQTPRVLVAESDPVSRELLANLLRMGGFDAVTAESGELGLAILRRERDEIDWLVSGIDLGGLACGWILADEFRAMHPTRAVLFSADRPDATALGSDEAVFAGEAASPVDLLEILKWLCAEEARVLAEERSSEIAVAA